MVRAKETWVRGVVLFTLALLSRPAWADGFELVGSVVPHPDHRAEVTTPASGRVVEVAVRAGDHVRRGQVLAWIESEATASARASYLTARAEETRAHANLAREEALVEARISAERAKEIATLEHAAARAHLAAAEETLLSLGYTRADLVVLARGQGQGRLALRAPIAGTVLERKVTLGQALARHAPAFSIVDIARLTVQLDVPEAQVDRLPEGQTLSVYAETAPQRPFRASVRLVAPTVDEATHTARVWLSFDNREAGLRLHQLVRARLADDLALLR